jgi:hypothetical protein
MWKRRWGNRTNKGLANDGKSKKRPATRTETFRQGDERINRHGRPPGFDLIRKLAQQVAHEEVTLDNGQRMSVIEAILRSWVLSKEPALQIALVEYAFGKVPPAKVETGLEGRTQLILHLGHE